MINLNSFHVVVVEDDPTLSGLLQELLEDYGARCSCYCTADDALVALLADRQPDLLITDHVVPGQLNGADLTEMLVGRWPSLPAVITTGYGYEITAALPTGVVYLQKPWLPETLEAAITKALQ